MTDATTDRKLLTEKAYANSSNLRARMSIYDYRNDTGDWWSWVLDHADWPAGASVLDVGCGPGSYLMRVKGIGLDLSEGMARESQQYAPTLVGDVCALPIATATVDRVLAPHMLYHALDLDQAASELRRVVAPGGTALVVTNDKSHMGHLVEQLSAVTGTDKVMRFVDRFDLVNGGAVLERHFDEVTIGHWIGELTVPDVEPVVAYADSCRSLYELQLAPGTTWEEAMATLRKMVEEEIAATGAWRCVTHSGVFVCR